MKIIAQTPPDPNKIIISRPDVLTGTATFTGVISATFKIFFIVGAAAVVLMILWGAVEWIFSGGDKEKLSHARSRIINGIIGFVILALAFLIAFIIGKISGFNPLQEFTIPSFTNAP